MAALDFPTATTDGQIFKADNGVWYTWVAAGSYWSGSLGTAIGNLEGYYVNKTGDKMFGNLTLGTESTTSIVLNATSGAATFDGRLTLNGTGAGTAAYIGNNGEVQITYQGNITTAGSITAAGRIRSNNGTSSTPAILGWGDQNVDAKLFQGQNAGGVTVFEVLSSGSASFAGDVQSGGDPNGGAAPGSRIYSGGIVQVARQNGLDKLWGGYQVGNATETSRINANGSAEFAGAITLGTGATAPAAEGSVYYPTAVNLRRDDGGAVYNVYRGGNTANDITLQFKSNGSAEFAGAVTIDDGILAEYVRAKRDLSSEQIPLFYGIDTNSGSNKNIFQVGSSGISLGTDMTYASGVVTGYNARIDLSGSATFAGDVYVGSNPFNGSGSGTLNSPSGFVAASRVSGSNVWVGWAQGSSSPTSAINSDGSVVFEGSGKFAGGTDLSSVSTNGLRISNNGELTIQRTSLNDTFFNGYRQTQKTVEIKADGSAKFAATVSAGNSTNGLYGVNAQSNSGDGGAQASVSAMNLNANGLNFRGRSDASTTTSKIFADGSAEFDYQTTVPTFVVLTLKSTLSGNKVRTFYHDANGTTVMVPRPGKLGLNCTGDATFAGTVTATVVPPSDARFKENITPAKPQLADVVALGGLLKNYDWNDQAPLNEEIRSQRQLGLIAQEAAEVCPAIVKDIHRTKTVEVTPAVTGPKGRVITEAVTEEVDDSYKGISTDALIMKLIGAVAELSAEVEALKSAA